jgi:hypothetical protein
MTAWEVSEIWDPEPKIVTPGNSFGDAPSDAIVLFDGLNLDKWVHKNGDPAKWDVKDGYFTVKPGTGDILSREVFGSCQLHVEFMSPVKIEGDGQNRGNSGVYFMENTEDGDTGYEIQVLDSYDNRTYSNGQAGDSTPPFSLKTGALNIISYVCHSPGFFEALTKGLCCLYTLPA